MKDQNILLLCHQINKGIGMIIINMEYFGCIIGSRETENNNMNIFFLMNGNIFNYSLAVEPYSFNGYSAFAIPPMPPGYGYLFAQSYINAYNTAFNQTNINRRIALNRYSPFTSDNINNDFIPGTFGYYEEYTGSISN